MDISDANTPRGFSPPLFARQVAMAKELCNYPAMLVSPHAAVEATADTIAEIDAEICSRRNEFCEAYMGTYESGRLDAIEVATRLESKGALPEDLPFMQRYVMTYGDLIQRKKEMSAETPIPAAISETTADWMPEPLPSEESFSIKDEQQEMQMKAQLLAEVQKLRATADTVPAPTIFKINGLHLHIQIYPAANTVVMEGCCGRGEGNQHFLHTVPASRYMYDPLGIMWYCRYNQNCYCLVRQVDPSHPMIVIQSSCSGGLECFGDPAVLLEMPDDESDEPHCAWELRTDKPIEPIV